MKEIDTDVLIVGSGLIGLVVAHCLSTLNYSVLIIDKKKFNKKSNKNKDIRTVAVSEGSKNFLESLSLWSELQLYAEPIKAIKVFDRAKSNKIFFENKENNKRLGYVIENSKFSSILRKKLNNKNIKKLDGSEVLKIDNLKGFPKTYTSDYVVNSKLVIASDGKNSNIRKLVGTNIYKKKYTESALVLNFFHKNFLDNTAYEIFYKTGPLAILPMKSLTKSPQSSIIWSNKNELVQNLVKRDNRFLKNYIEERVGSIVGKITKINSKQVFPLSAHINETFTSRRLVYVGDSAHSIHPIAGQGWNLGVKDVKNLYFLLKKYKNNKSDIGSNVFCKEYNELNYKNAFQLYQITDKLNAHFKNTSTLLRLLSNAGFLIINDSPHIKNKITKYAMGY